MKFFTVLLLASLASASPVVLHEPRDEPHLDIQNTDTGFQFIQTSQLNTESISSENLSKQPFLFREELISREDVVIEATRPKCQKAQPQHPQLQERLRSTERQPEETTELTPRAATTSEGKLAKLGHAMRKDLDKMIKGVVNYVKDIPGANGIMRL